MKIIAFVIATLGLAWMESAQRAHGGLVVYTFSFTDGTGNATSISPAATPNFLVSGFTIGNSAGVVNIPINSTSQSNNYGGATAGNNIGNVFAIGALDVATSGFLSLTVNNSTGSSQSLIDFDFGARSTNTGPQAYSLRTGNLFSFEIATGTITNNSSWSLKDNTFGAINLGTGVTELRLYGYNGIPTVNQVNGRFDDIKVTFDIAAVPEPSSVILLGVAGGVITAARMRRRAASGAEREIV